MRLRGVLVAALVVGAIAAAGGRTRMYAPGGSSAGGASFDGNTDFIDAGSGLVGGCSMNNQTVACGTAYFGFIDAGSINAFSVDAGVVAAKTIYSKETTGNVALWLSTGARIGSADNSNGRCYFDGSGIFTCLTGGMYTTGPFTSTGLVTGNTLSVTSTATVGSLSTSGTIASSGSTVSARGYLMNGSTMLPFVVPTITGFGTSAFVTGSTPQFRINVGTGGSASTGTITGLTAAGTGYHCWCDNITTPTGYHTFQNGAGTTTTCPLINLGTSWTATAWTASDVLVCNVQAN